MTTSTYQVTETQPLVSPKRVGQAAIVGRDTTGGIHLHLTHAAAEALAGILARYEAVHTAFRKHHGEDADDDYDADLWVHVAVNLLATRALAIATARPGTLQRQTAYASSELPSPRPRAEVEAETGRPLEVVVDIAQLSEELLSALDGRAAHR